MTLFANTIRHPWKDNIIFNLVQFSAFIFGAFSVAVPSGYSYGPAFLFLLSLTVIWRKEYWSGMSREVKLLGAIFILYFLVQAISIWLDGGRLRELDRPSRALMAACMLPLLSRYPAHLTSLLFGFSTGAILAGSIAIYEKFYIGAARSFYNEMPIQMGDISMTLALLSLCGFFYAKSRGLKKQECFFIIGAVMGMIASFLSGTRGGWILLPMILSSIIFFYRNVISKRDMTIMFIFSVLFVGLIALPQTGVMSRLYAAYDDIINYTWGVDVNTSLGVRIQLWESAWFAFIEKPIFGWGNHGIGVFLDNSVEHGLVTPYIRYFFMSSHAHNQFLDELAKRGIIGFITLLSLCIVPSLISKRDSKRPEAILLIVSSITLIDYSLSQAFLSHNSGIIFYSVLFSLITTGFINNQSNGL